MNILRVTSWQWRTAAAVLICTLAWTACPSVHGAGLAAFKEQPFHGDDLATIIVYSTIRETASSYQLDLGNKEMSLDRSKIAGHVTVPELPANIQDENVTAQLRNTLATLSSFAGRYKKAVPILKPYADQLKTAIARREAGEVRINSKWLSQSEQADVMRRGEEARERARLAQELAQRKQQEADKKKMALEAERQEAMRIAELVKQRGLEVERQKQMVFNTEQRSKGLEEYNGTWLPKSEAAALHRRDIELWYAGNDLDERSLMNAEYAALGATSEGMLIKPLGADVKPQDINVDVAFLYGSYRGTVAEGDLFRGDLFWCGTRTFDLEKGSVTVHAYRLNRNEALEQVRAALYPKDAGRGRPGPEMVGAAPRTNPSKPLEGASGNGSGFFVGNEGYFVTNQHVVEGTSAVEVYYGGKLLPAKVMHTSKAVDLALLKVDAAVAGLVVAEEEMELGIDVIAVGYPRATLQGIEPKVTKGIISSKRGMEDEDTRYQIDAAIQPGNSGGPLCDVSGRVVGVIVSTLNPASKAGPAPQNVNYAIKASELAAFLRSRSVKFAQAGRSSGSDAQGPVAHGVKIAVAASALVVTRE